MITKIKNVFNLIQNMGFRYIKFRIMYEFKIRTGLLKLSYPTGYKKNNDINLEKWKENTPLFFFKERSDINIPNLSIEAKKVLDTEFKAIKEGEIKFFNAFYLSIPANEWTTNPSTQATYQPLEHWTKIKDLDTQKGDIKFVWEKSRFSYIYTIIRYDHHFNSDNSEQVFNDILSWIDSNPGNMGPNFKCSQEISLRVLNWTFALYFYKNSKFLTDVVFDKIMSAIHLQIKHVESNINFSRIAVRNNHAITETLMLYLGGLLFPFFKESKQWKEKGKKFLTEEGLYQIYDDGSFLQFSMNYHRVMTQLFTWYCFLADKHQETIPNELAARIKKANDFLYAHQDLNTGWLPNYGANDGALFFKLSSLDYRDYRPQINALNFYFTKEMLYDNTDCQEDCFWYTKVDSVKINQKSQKTITTFPIGGFNVLRHNQTFSTIRCGSYKDRPSQADNLHVDIWHNGKNYVRDNGSYKYNTEPEIIKYFVGTASHNTVQIGDLDQMKKGGRFIWYNWSESIYSNSQETIDYLEFEGHCKVYTYLNTSIVHKRIVKQFKNTILFEINDKIENIENINLPIKQLWHISADFEKDGWKIECRDEKNNLLKPNYIKALHSAYYGMKEESTCISFENSKGIFNTKIIKL